MIPSLHHLELVFSAYIIAAGSPGPSTMRIIGVAMDQGRRAGLSLAAGVVTGSIFWGLMAATGVSAILMRYPQALIALKIFGGFYLLFHPRGRLGRLDEGVGRLHAPRPVDHHHCRHDRQLRAPGLGDAHPAARYGLRCLGRDRRDRSICL